MLLLVPGWVMRLGAVAAAATEDPGRSRTGWVVSKTAPPRNYFVFTIRFAYDMRIENPHVWLGVCVYTPAGYPYAVRMSDTQDAEASAGRTLADMRWRGAGVDRAIETLERRAEQLTTERLERLRALVDEPKAGA
jgi:hypothetical protein